MRGLQPYYLVTSEYLRHNHLDVNIKEAPPPSELLISHLASIFSMYTVLMSSRPLAPTARSEWISISWPRSSLAPPWGRTAGHDADFHRAVKCRYNEDDLVILCLHFLCEEMRGHNCPDQLDVLGFHSLAAMLCRRNEITKYKPRQKCFSKIYC